MLRYLCDDGPYSSSDRCQISKLLYCTRIIMATQPRQSDISSSRRHQPLLLHVKVFYLLHLSPLSKPTERCMQRFPFWPRLINAKVSARGLINARKCRRSRCNELFAKVTLLLIRVKISIELRPLTSKFDSISKFEHKADNLACFHALANALTMKLELE